MEITRDVILDLLPLYLADEVSADTRAIIDKYLETDSELANLAQKTAKIQLSEDIPIPLSKENQMEAYKEAQRLILRRTVIWAAVIAVALLACTGLTAMAIFFLVSAR
jgi:anti-sigma factor RsiW